MNSEQGPKTTVNYTREKIFALLTLLSNDDCQYPIWDNIANKMRMSKDEEVKERNNLIYF
jgi:hypothetical protein